MRIVIDLQGAQTHSRQRGIGRYSLSLAQAIVRNRGDHDIFLVLNGLLPEATLDIRTHFDGLLPQEQILIWQAPGPIRELEAVNLIRRESAECLREAFIANLKPDLIHIMSLFEGFGDDAATSIGNFDTSTPVSLTLYDLIPLLNPSQYLHQNPAYERYYQQKISYLRRASLCLAISESSRQEAIDELGLDSDSVVTISTAGEPHFKPLTLTKFERKQLFTDFGILRSFLMYTGGIDYRKNVEGLIRAYSQLPKDLRVQYQLLIVCSINPQDHQRLMDLGKKLGLTGEDLILTGRVTESDLVLLYNTCTLFIFPSLHEGFGLPVLEAMACGAPVIASNSSSLPEVLNNPEALFDPHDDGAIAEKMEWALLNEDFRNRLVDCGLKQAKQFSWDRSARRAIEAWEAFYAASSRPTLPDLEVSLGQGLARKPRLAFLSPLPPARSGISDYSAQLLPELSQFYSIEIIALNGDVISDPWIEANCPIRTIDWFTKHAQEFDRVLYQFGNSTVHTPLFKLLQEIPGIVVLHDFFLSGIVAEMEFRLNTNGSWAENLYVSHGYEAVFARYHADDTADVVWKYPCNLPVLQDAIGTIVHSKHSRDLFEHWYGEEAKTSCTTIPLLRPAPRMLDRRAAREFLGIAPDDFLVCSFGILGATKLNIELLEAWYSSALASSQSCRLVFVGECGNSNYLQTMQKLIEQQGCTAYVEITGWTSAEHYTAYLIAADLAVQLRSLSRGETSAAVLDCLNYGLPTIVNAHGSMAEFSAEHVLQLPDLFSTADLMHALELLWADARLREQLSRGGQDLIRADHSPSVCALRYAEAIESYYAQNAIGLGTLTTRIAELLPLPQSGNLGMQLAESIDSSIPPKYRCQQILVDVSELVLQDSKTGIQRVVRSILSAWLHNPPSGYRIEPVYATPNQGYRYARGYTLGFLSCSSAGFQDEPISFYAGDHFLGLDLQPQVVLARAADYRVMRERGVHVQFVVYDLLPLLMPQFFHPGADLVHAAWLNVVSRAHGLLCISKSVAKELAVWKRSQDPPPSCDIRWFHLGADVRASKPTFGLPLSSFEILQQIRERPSFLMVGTIEPRKDQETVVRAFERLWLAGKDFNLVIVGKSGWLNEHFIQYLKEHPERNQRLIWLDAISDEYLETIYRSCQCLIAASQGEGFGLPLIEAAQYGLPILARDLPVFQEVAGPHAFYFSGSTPEAIAQALEEWIGLFEQGRQPQSRSMPSLSWSESAQQLLGLVLPDQSKPRLAFFMPSVPQQTSITDDALTLLPELAQFYRITLIQDFVAPVYMNAPPSLPVESIAWFEAHFNDFNRILYQAGKHSLNTQLLERLRRFPGIVVLHDFSLGELWERGEEHGDNLCAWADALYFPHGYLPLIRLFEPGMLTRVHDQYPAYLEVFECANSIIIQAEHIRDFAPAWYGSSMAHNPPCVPSARTISSQREHPFIASSESRGSKATPQAQYDSTAQQNMRYKHHPRVCAAVYAALIESNYARHCVDDCYVAPVWLKNLPAVPIQPEQSDTTLLGPNLAWSHRLFVDVSVISRSNLHSGIERVVRAQLMALLLNPPTGFRVEPVYLESHSPDLHYRFARNYVSRLLKFPIQPRPELPINPVAGDIFYGADFCQTEVVRAAQAGIYAKWRAEGVKISFLVYDLLPVQHPEFFPPKVDEDHRLWLSSIGNNADQLIAISGAVASDLGEYLHAHPTQSNRLPAIEFVHQGANLDASLPSVGLPHDAVFVLDQIVNKPTFLMVGTIEPRKGLLQSIAAFEALWDQGLDVQLLVVGREGWVGLPAEQRRTVPTIMHKLKGHSELGKRLLWLPEASDEYLQKIYGSVACLLMASEGEGFGLPLIEAAAFKCPILARDLPVFHEIAGANATYFEGVKAHDLSQAIESWLRSWHSKQLPSSEGISYLSWEQNAMQLTTKLLSHN